MPDVNKIKRSRGRPKRNISADTATDSMLQAMSKGSSNYDEFVLTGKPILACHDGKVVEIEPHDELFCEEYTKDGSDRSTANAAIRAGFTPKNGNVKSFGAMASQRKKRLLWRINQLDAMQGRRVTVTPDYVIYKLLDMVAKCSEARPVLTKQGKPLIIHDNKHGDVQAVYQIDSKGLAAALSMLGKHLGMYTDKVEVTDNSSLAEQLRSARLRATKATNALANHSGANNDNTHIIDASIVSPSPAGKPVFDDCIADPIPLPAVHDAAVQAPPVPPGPPARTYSHEGGQHDSENKH